MKIGVSSYSFARYMHLTGADYFDIARIAKEQGFDAIEFLPLVKRSQDATVIDTARALRAHCDALGLSICAYTVDADLLNGRGCKPEEEENRLMRCVDVCAALGAPVMRHDTLWQLKEGMTWQDAIPLVAPAIRRVTEYAARLSVRTCTENHGYIFQDSPRVKALIEAVGHPNFGWLVDIGNFACADEENVSAVATAAPYAFHAHAKDFLVKPSNAFNPGKGWFPSRNGKYLRGTVVGHGQIPVISCIKALKDAGYEGFISLEFEGMEENLPALEAGLDFLRRADAAQA